MRVDPLQKLNQGIALSLRLIGEQKDRIKELTRDGHDTAVAREILVALEASLEDATAERDATLRDLELHWLADDGEGYPLADTDGPFGGIPLVARYENDQSTRSLHRPAAQLKEHVVGGGLS